MLFVFLPKLNTSTTAKLTFYFPPYPQGKLDCFAAPVIQGRKPRTLGLS